MTRQAANGYARTLDHGGEPRASNDSAHPDEDEGSRMAKAQGYRAWTTHEVAIVREHYPMGGPHACAALLPRRTLGAIQQQARSLGLWAPRQSKQTRHWASSDRIDAQIRRVYQSTPRKSGVAELAARLYRPRWWVSRRARQLGLVVPRFKEPAWSAAEVAMLERHTHKHDEVVARLFRQAGFPRSATAIHVKRKRLKLTLAEGRRDAGLYSATELAELLGVDRKTVTRWITQENLPAIRRGTARTSAQGGDEWEISAVKLRGWIRDHAQLVDLRKVDRFWFIDLAFGARS